ncbi:putative membrane protein YfcA [Rhodobium orientis]|uniref:Probable membrane transporter protein n=1 Tax=Rhodobium orientis TaxID=34017 RepID=A0A327JVL9_9HYPH|nr:sulfite exporter TauE/SafE family protein [Rhodobium orientis]MBB4304100.1 putative membrane protein YfcA [Rhodobium orientis]MBK5948829.1 hypothetical protein [Rhodobium orientis]RAI29626.1 hypothetical protein CH339_02995 [Rhodobium orientis]
MELTAPIGEIVMLAAALATAGAVAGVLAGLFGIGGGAILVPVLYQFLAFLGVDEAVRMHLSVGTSLGIIIPTSIRSFMAHKARGAVDMELLKTWAIPVPAGVVIGSLIAAYVSADGLKLIFAVIATVVAAKMLFDRGGLRLGDDIPGNPVRAIIGGFIGLVSTLMGIGGGVMNNTFMTLYGRPIHQAVATSAGTGTLISVPGMIGFMWAGWGAPGLPPFSIGYVNLLAMLLVVPITVLVAPFGVSLAHRLSRRGLQLFFGIFLLIVAVRFVLSLFL